MPRKPRKNASVDPESNLKESIETEKDKGILPINKRFADKYEASKRREFLNNSSVALLQSSDDLSSSSEEEDELGELLTKGIDKRFKETIEAIRRKDPRIYDKSTKFFESQSDGEQDDDKSQRSYHSEDEPVAGWDSIAEVAKRDTTKLTLKDYVRENLLKDGRLSDNDTDTENDIEEGKHMNGTFTQEKAFVGSIESRNARPNSHLKVGSDLLGSESEGEEKEEEDENFFTKKKKNINEIEKEEQEFDKFLKKQSHKRAQQTGDELLLHSYLEKENPDEKERFLRDFVMNNGWLDKNAVDAPGASDYKIEIDLPGEVDEKIEEDENFEEKNDEFEAKYNFRFEDPDGSNVVSYARKISDSMRRPDDRRKKAREARRLRKQLEKAAKIEDIKHLKNLKKKEIQARLLAIQEAAGDELDTTGFDLEGDFDPEEFNKQMERNFGDGYYSREDTHMKGQEKLKERGLQETYAITARSNVPEDVQDDVGRLIDEYYNLNYEDIVGGVPVRFKYKKVAPESFNMTPEHILTTDDRELNSLVSLKYLAPYRSEREVKKKAWKAASTMRKKRISDQGRRYGEPASDIDVGKNERANRDSSKKKRRRRGESAEDIDAKQAEEDDGWGDVIVNPLEATGNEESKLDEADRANNMKSKRKRKKRKQRGCVPVTKDT
ncbi:unnamed protein product [Agarophyton chilense]|eukprot:gb/GEZJ01003737.1/.p1 GENE.gb/GEZJ01003737.1/~~gb/GEZJ01003737.1/.p1  ORF type:complete len:666 (+),score=175.68 gb/GEZJ01003737.1/:127-2124(+)